MTGSSTTTSGEPRRVSRVASTASLVGTAGVALVAAGIVGIHIGVLRPLVGFYLFGAGAVLCGVLALVLAGLALFTTRGGRDPHGRRRALVGLATGVALFAMVVVGARPGAGLPAINDITTDLDDPPQFTAAAGEPANAGRDMSYPSEFVPLVRKAYPDLAPITLAAPPPEVFGWAVDTAEALGWEVTFSDPRSGEFEARDTSSVFQFVDDVRVRVRPDGTGSVVDVRSKSRVGRGDVGANANRIRSFAGALRERAGQRG